MNYLWAGMMLVAIVYGAIHGTIPEVTQAALDSSKEAVTLCVTMLGILSFWLGGMLSASAPGLFGTGADCGELYCECAGPRLGGDTGGAEGHGRA